MGTRYSRRLVTVAASNDGAMMKPGVRGNKPASRDTVLRAAECAVLTFAGYTLM